jgi:hypothetical protein
MDFVAVLDQVITLLRQRGRVAYRTLKVQFHLDDEALEALKDELLSAQQVARDEDERILVWTGAAGSAPVASSVPAETPARAPLTYMPAYLAEKILTSRSALEGERKQVTVLFADLKGSMELLADRDPEEARQLLDPVLERLMAAVHRYEGTVNPHSSEFSGDALRYSQYACHFKTLPPPCLIHTHHCRQGDETWHRPPKRLAKTEPSLSTSRTHPPTSS